MERGETINVSKPSDNVKYKLLKKIKSAFCYTVHSYVLNHIHFLEILVSFGAV